MSTDPTSRPGRADGPSTIPVMPSTATSVDALLESILRGAAMLLGCNSANLIVFNEKKREASVRVGVFAEQDPVIREVERTFGAPLKGAAFPVESIEDSMALEALLTQRVRETSSLADLVGRVFPQAVVAAVAELIGPRRFILVPVLHAQRGFGVIIFEKDSTTPFSAQQREVMLRYAQRIGALLDNDVRRLGPALAAGPDAPRTSYLLLAADGEVLGGEVAGPQADVAEWRWPPDLLSCVRAEAARFDPADPVSWPSVFEWPRGADAAAADGARWEVQLTPFRLGSTVRTLAVLRERPSQPVASVSRQLLHFALGETAPTLMVGPDFRITSCNDALERALGYTQSELRGANVDTVFADPRAIRSMLNHQFLALADGYHEEDVVVRRSDGGTFLAGVRALMLVDAGQSVIGFLVMIRLGGGAGASTDAGDRVMRQERLATMGELAAQLAHEIRNPLLAIGATLESIFEGREHSDEVLPLVRSEITRLDHILRDYMSLAVRYSAAVVPVSLADVLRDVARVVAADSRGSRCRITVDAPEDAVVLADFEGLKQVFFNLLLNALEASPEGGTVACAAVTEGAIVRCHVDDEGPGLAQSVEQCFEPFFTTKSNGTGLGLTVARKIVAAHGGTVALADRPGGGCRVTVTIPRKEVG